MELANQLFAVVMRIMGVMYGICYNYGTELRGVVDRWFIQIGYGTLFAGESYVAQVMKMRGFNTSFHAMLAVQSLEIEDLFGVYDEESLMQSTNNTHW